MDCSKLDDSLPSPRDFSPGDTISSFGRHKHLLSGSTSKRREPTRSYLRDGSRQDASWLGAPVALRLKTRAKNANHSVVPREVQRFEKEFFERTKMVNFDDSLSTGSGILRVNSLTASPQAPRPTTQAGIN